jgi:hypothetical protein
MITSNENKMSDGGPARNRFAVAMRARRERVSRGSEVLKSSQEWSVPRSAVRSIAWLDASCGENARLTSG